MSCSRVGPVWRRACRRVLGSTARVSVGLTGVALIVAHAWLPKVAAVDSAALALGVGVVVLAVVLPVIAEAEIGPGGLRYKRVTEQRDSAFLQGLPEVQKAAFTRFAARLSGDEAWASQLVEDALARAYVDWHRIPLSDRRLYVLCAIVRLALSRRRLGLIVDRPPSGDPSAALASLDLRARALLLLRDYEGVPDQAIALIMGRPLGEVKAELTRAEAELDALLAGPTVAPT